MKNVILFLLFFPIFVFATPSTVVYNVTHGEVMGGALYGEAVSIASISKLMTAYIVLSHNQSLDEPLTVTGNKIVSTRISKGMILSRRDLLKLALVSSDNLAAITLSENFPGGRIKFIEAMNRHALNLGMIRTGFVEPTGLSPMNYSTIEDIIKLTNAVSVFDIVQTAARSTRIITQYTLGKHITNIASNSTIKYFGRQGIITIKTGFTNAAGFCVTMLINANNQLYNITVLGARSKQEREALIKKSLATIY